MSESLEKLKAEFERIGADAFADVDKLPLREWLEAHIFLCRQMALKRSTPPTCPSDELWYRVYEYQGLAYQRVLEKLTKHSQQMSEGFERLWQNRHEGANEIARKFGMPEQ